MPLVVPRKVTFLAKSEYFTSPGPKGLLKKVTFKALGQVPVDRSGGRRSEAALITGLQVLAEGKCLGIYPEGTRSPDGRLYKGRTGIARLAIESGAPVIPVAMSNTDKIQPTGQVIPNLHRVGMIFGILVSWIIPKQNQELRGSENYGDYAVVWKRNWNLSIMTNSRVFVKGWQNIVVVAENGEGRGHAVRNVEILVNDAFFV